MEGEEEEDEWEEEEEEDQEQDKQDSEEGRGVRRIAKENEGGIHGGGNHWG